MSIPLIALIVQGIPEQIAIVTLSFIIANIPLDWLKIVLIGIALAFIAYLIRLFPITFGLHTLFLIWVQFLILVQLCKLSVLTSLRATLISILTLIVVETICVSMLMSIFHLTLEIFHQDIFIRILISLPQVFLIFLIAFIIFKIRVKRKENESI